jgi:hypothetical protein
MLGGRLGGRFIPILIDMQEMALLINGMGDFFGEIAYQIARTCSKAGLAITEPEMEAFAAAPTRIFNRFLDALEDALDGRQLLLIFDEFELIEGKITDNKLDPEVLGYFRSLIQHRDGLVFIFAGTHRLEEMSHDYWSILFNIAVYRRVSFLERAEAVDLIRLPVKGALDVDDLAVEKVIAVTNGHPYFIQLICWALVNRCNGAERNYATLNDVNDAIDEILTTGEAHFAYIWQQATDDERLALAGLAHTLKPGKLWARPAEVAEMLEANGEPVEQSTLIDVLDGLAAQETLESAADGALRYRFRIDVLKLWVMMNKSIAALGERRR